MATAKYKIRSAKPGPRQQGYSKRWEKRARRELKRNPVCANFGKDPRCAGVAKHLDHIVDKSIAPDRFWDPTNWQPLCIPCHNRKTAEENKGKPRPSKPARMDYDKHGNPIGLVNAEHWER